MDASNPHCAFVMSFFHAELIIAHLKGTSQREKTAFLQRTLTGTMKQKKQPLLVVPCGAVQKKTRGRSLTESVGRKGAAVKSGHKNRL